MPGPASYFNYADLGALPAATAELVKRRRSSMGAAYRLFYADPVEIVRGRGTRMYDAEGVEYLDAYNNVPTVGHAHPRVVEAISDQVARLNTHTRYLDEAVVRYSEDLLSTFSCALDNVMYTCTGSEANDLALRIVKFITGGEGVIVTREAYHGITTETAAISPSLGGPDSVADWVELVSAPGASGGSSDFTADVRSALDRFKARRVSPAALIFDTIFASDGVFTPEPAVIAPAIEAVRSAGGLIIADEVQAGFGRLGEGMWGYDTLGVQPDLVTIGKPMGSGQAIAAVIAGHDLIDRFGAEMRYFSTFAANTVAIAAAQATLDVVRDERLIDNASSSGRALRDGIVELAVRHPRVGAVRGNGLFLGVEVITDPINRSPAGAYAFDVVNGMRERRVLIAAVGPGRNILKIRPPLSFNAEDVEMFLSALDESLSEIPFRR